MPNPWDKFLILCRARHSVLLPHVKRLFQSHETCLKICVLHHSSPFSIHILNHHLQAENLPICSYKIDPSRKNAEEALPSDILSSGTCIYLNLRTAHSTGIHAIQMVVDWAKNHTIPVVLLPLLILPRRDPANVRTATRISTICNGSKVVISCGTPIELKPFLTQYTGQNPPSHLRRMMLRSLRREHRVLTGNKPESRRTLIKRLMKSPELDPLQSAGNRRSKLTPDEAAKKIRGYIREIAADYWDALPRLWRLILKLSLFRLYDGIEFDHEGLKRLRTTIGSNRRCILVPTHRRHMDYITLSLGCYIEGIVPPLIAAGKNLAFWPMGFVFRHSGAFFIRRSFRGLDLYPKVFKHYVLDLLRKPQPIEFFIEGGRSRSGRLLKPKLGFLRILMDALQENHTPHLEILPIAINYDRVIEAENYLRELSGATKSKEGIFGLIRSRHILKRKYGRIYVSIGEPLELSTETYPGLFSSETRENIAQEIMYRLGTNLTVTPMALVASSLLNYREKSVAESAVLETAMVFLGYLKTRTCTFSHSLQTDADPQRTITDAIDFLISNTLLEHSVGSDGRILDLPTDDSRRLLDYSKNSLAALILPASVASLAILSGVNKAEFSQFILNLLCPHVHPVHPGNLLADTDKAGEHFSDAPPETLRLFSRFVYPILGLLIEIHHDLQSETSPCQTMDYDAMKDRLRASVRSSIQETEFKELHTIEIPDLIRRIFLANAVLVKDESGRFSFQSSQSDNWIRLADLLQTVWQDSTAPH